MGSGTQLMLGVLFGAIGAGYFVYGKKQRHGMALLAGVLLCGLPYFISDAFLLTLSCLACMALPFVFEYWW